jgi:glycosyltransferase involved in cell wall biosynthesis
VTRRLLLASGFYPPYVGGIERHTAGLAQQFASRGWAVDVVCSADGQERTNPVSPQPGRVRLGLLKTHSVQGRLPVPLPTKHNRRLLSDVNSTDYTLAVVQSHLHISNVLVALAVRNTVPLAVVGHGSGPVPTETAFQDHLVSGYERTLAYALQRRVDFTFAVSAEACEWMEHLGFSTSGVVANAVADRPHPEISSSGSGELVYLYAGRLEPGKGADRAIEMAVRCAESNSIANVRLLVAGGGSQAGHVQEQAARHPEVVKYLGVLDRASMDQVMKDADVFVYPSTYPEGFPTVLLEAAVAGCGILTYPVPGATELVDEGRGGWIVRNIAEGATVMGQLASDPELARTAGKAAYLTVKGNFTWEKVTDSLLSQVGLEA